MVTDGRRALGRKGLPMPSPPPSSVRELDLSPVPGKEYFGCSREWREEFIYFLLVDRFHDDTARSPHLGTGRSTGVATPDDFYGGTLRGVTRNLDYIAGLGCTTIWLSPVFENNPGAYHGYNISDYLRIDPHFGTAQDLVDLVDAAHRRNPPIRVVLDVVINHSGDNWYYPGDVPYSYAGGQRFDLGGWRRPDRPVPTELRDPDLYHRRGQITGGGWDATPEGQLGDVVTLKDFHNDDDDAGSTSINVLIQAHCYWIREADVDGFRVDAVKHMGELACSRFSSMIREYAYSLGKQGFFLFGEAATPDDELYDRYIGPNTSRGGDQTVFFGIDSLLDFRLGQGAGPGREPLRDVLKGFFPPQTLFDRADAQRRRALNRGELGRYLVTFVDNHDSFWQPGGRIARQAPDEQVVAAIGYLLCALGTPCIYYGTEQGFAGQGGDNAMREAMFDVTQPGTNLLNTDCAIYQGIAQIARVMRTTPSLRFGRMYFRQISGDGVTFGFPFGTDYTLAFSRLLYGHEVLVAYNVSSSPRADCIVVDSGLHRPGDVLHPRYGGAGDVPVETAPDGTAFVRLALAGHQFVILE
jgi:glycosidase